MDYYNSDEDDCCPLCMEEIEVDDKYFKPCPCGYQLCRFCWNHIKNDLNGLCPACRRPYSDDAIEFKPVPPEELIRIKNDKKKRDRERKEQGSVAKKQLSNVRVVQKNLVYVLGLPIKLATEDTLKSNDYFGQYGKITKVVVNRRNPAVGPNTHFSSPATSNTGVYITFQKKDDAARAIEAVDGTNYEGKIIRATFGTTKYCSYFLKGQICANVGCQFLHENGEDAEAYLKEEARLYHQRHEKSKHAAFAPRPTDHSLDGGSASLPPSASWAKSGTATRNTSASEFYDAIDHSSDFENDNFSQSPSTSNLPTHVVPLNDETHYPSLESSVNIVSESSHSFPNNATASNNASKRKQRQIAVAAALSNQIPNSTNSQMVPEKEITLGSGALDPDTSVPDLSEYLASNAYVSPFDAGYTLIPRYNGFFDPFGNSKLTELLLAGAARGGPGPSSPSNGGGGAGPTDGSGNQNEGGYGSMNGEKQGENDGKRSPSSTSQNVPQQQQYQQVQQQNQKSRYERFFNGKVPVIQMEQKNEEWKKSSGNQSASGMSSRFQQQDQIQQQHYKIQRYQQQMAAAYGNNSSGEYPPHFLKDPSSGGIHGRVSGPTANQWSGDALSTTLGDMMPSFDTPFIPSSYTFPPLGPSKPSSPSTDVHLNETFNLKSNNTNDTLANHKSSIHIRQDESFLEETPPANQAPKQKNQNQRTLEVLKTPVESAITEVNPSSFKNQTNSSENTRKKVMESDKQSLIVETIEKQSVVAETAAVNESTKNENDTEIAPIVSRKTKKKKIQSPKVNKTIKSKNVESETEAKSLPVSDQDTPVNKSLGSPESSMNILLDESEDIVLVLEKVVEKSTFLVSQLQELNFDGKLDHRIEKNTDIGQIKHILDTINRSSDPISTLAKCPDLGKFVESRLCLIENENFRSFLGKNVLNSMALSLYCVNKISILIMKGLEAKINYSRQHHGRKRIKNFVSEWNPFLEQATAIRDSSLGGLNVIYEGGADKVSAQAINLTKIPKPKPSPITENEKILPPTNLDQDTPLSVEQYLDELLTAIHDFVYMRSSPKRYNDASAISDEARSLPWITLAAATGLDPHNFDVCQQIELIHSLQNAFPSPRELVALIIENPADPRLRFKSLKKERSKVAMQFLTSKVSHLQKKLRDDRNNERNLEIQLEAIKIRNDAWRPSVFNHLGLSFKPIIIDDAVEDDLDDEWIDA